MARKLGKLAPKADARTFLLAKYLDATKLPPLPPSIDWGSRVAAWGMMLNDSVGDCTCAAAGHAVQCWTENASGAEDTIADADILVAYEAVSGYDPRDPSTDAGAAELDVLNYWRGTGVGGHKIGAFALLARAAGGAHDAAWIDHVRAAIALLGAAYIGLAMPVAWQGASAWAVPAGGPQGDGAPGGWGGHAVILTGYRPAPARHGGWDFTAITWGAPITITANALLSYADEVWALFSQDFIADTGRAPSGFDAAALRADLAALKHA